jgi:hypothetical protein
MNINFYQSAVHNAEYDHANARVYDPADPLAVIIINFQELEKKKRFKVFYSFSLWLEIE